MKCIVLNIDIGIETRINYFLNRYCITGFKIVNKYGKKSDNVEKKIEILEFCTF